MYVYPSLAADGPAEEAEYLLITPLGAAPRRAWRLVPVAAFILLVLAAALSTAGYFWLSADDGARIEIALPPAMPADLLDATRGAHALQQAQGREAQAINASLPFSSAPVEAARPFGLVAGGLSDHERALLCLTQAVYYEAGFEPVEGRRAVAQVVLNRVRHPAFPHSVCGVVYDGSSRPGCQFSFTCDGSLRRPPAPAAWAAAREVAREALAGAVVPEVGLATHYHANYVAPYWAPRLTKLTQIGAHIFYRWPGGWGRQAAFSSRYSGLEAIGRTYQPTAVTASAEMAVAPPPDPTDRRAPEDVGGRLDVTKGWTLSIPLPSETGGHFASATSRQAVEPGAEGPRP